MCLLSVWKPHILPLDHQVTINSMIRFLLKWWMNTNRFVQGMSIHPPDPKTFLYTDASHYGWGAHTDESILSWSLVGRPIPAPYRHVGNNGHLFRTDKALKYIYHSCVMISTDNTTAVSCINKQGGTHSPNLCVEVWKILQWCLKHHIVVGIHHIPGKFNVLANRLSRIDKIVKTEWDWINWQRIQFSKCSTIPVWICLRHVSIKNFHFMCPKFWTSNLHDKHIFHELEQYSCLRISSNNTNSFCPEQDSPISVQNNSYSTSLAATNMALRGSTTTCLSSSLSSTLSKLLTSKRKVSTLISPSTQPSHLGVIKQSVRDRKFLQTLQNLSPNQDEHQLRKSMTRNGLYIPVGVIEGRLIWSRPILLL